MASKHGTPSYPSLKAKRYRVMCHSQLEEAADEYLNNKFVKLMELGYSPRWVNGNIECVEEDGYVTYLKVEDNV